MNLNLFCELFVSGGLSLSNQIVNDDGFVDDLFFKISKVLENHFENPIHEDFEIYNLIITCLKLKRIPNLPLKVTSLVADSLRKKREYELAIFLLKDFYIKNPNHLTMAIKYASFLHDIKEYKDAEYVLKPWVSEKLEKLKGWQMFSALRTVVRTNSKQDIQSLFDDYSKIVGQKAALIAFSKAFIDASKYEEGYSFWTENLSTPRGGLEVDECLIEFELLRLKGDIKQASDFLEYALDKHHNTFELRRQIIVMSRTNSFHEAILRLEAQNFNHSVSKEVYNAIESGEVTSDRLSCPWGVSTQVWHEILELIGSFDSETCVPFPSNMAIVNKSVSKVFVAGMDWSGSGAIQHYLLEYNKIRQVPGGELQFLAGVGGLKSILDSFGSRIKVKKAIIDFLGFHVLLTNSPTSNQESKALMTSSLLLTKLNIDRFLQVLVRMIYRVRLNWDSHDGIRGALQEYVNGVLLSLVNYSDDIVYLFDNAVGLFKCEAMQIVDNFYYYAVVRDPRSNYVTRVLQDTSYKRDVDKYIEVYRSRRKSFEEGKLSIVGKTNGVIELIQFEDFVCDESIRERIANDCGLGVLDTNKHSRFKPWESMKNVTIYYDYNRRDELMKLESELGNYCWNKKV